MAATSNQLTGRHEAIDHTLQHFERSRGIDGLVLVCLALLAVAPWPSGIDVCGWPCQHPARCHATHGAQRLTTRFEASALASGWWIVAIFLSWRWRSCALSGTGRPGHRAKTGWDAQPAGFAILAAVRACKLSGSSCRAVHAGCPLWRSARQLCWCAMPLQPRPLPDQA